MQTIRENDWEAAGLISPDIDIWMAHNCVYCKNRKTCDLYFAFLDSKKDADFKSSTLDCPWLRVKGN